MHSDLALITQLGSGKAGMPAQTVYPLSSLPATDGDTVLESSSHLTKTTQVGGGKSPRFTHQPFLVGSSHTSACCVYV